MIENPLFQVGFCLGLLVGLFFLALAAIPAMVDERLRKAEKRKKAAK